MLIPPSPPAAPRRWHNPRRRHNTLRRTRQIRSCGTAERGSVRFFPSRGSRRVGELSTLPEQSAGLSAQLIAAVRPAITGRTKTIKFVASPRNPRAFWFPIAECNNYFASRFSAELLVSQISHSTDGQLQEECPVGSQAVVEKRAFEISVLLVLSRRTQSIYWRRWQSLISQKQCFSLKRDGKQIC